jgi:hypothetical protein
MTRRLVAPEKTKKEKGGRTRRTGEISRQGGMETEVDGAVESHAVAGWGVYANGAGMSFLVDAKPDGIGRVLVATPGWGGR